MAISYDERRAAASTKVPAVTALFWVIKVLTTGMGETASDWLAHRLDPPVAVGLGAIAFAAALILQLAVRRYVAWIYWTAVVMVSVFGTMAADVLHVGLGVPYLVSTLFYLAVLAAVFAVWARTEKTLSVHSIDTRRRELFYWAAVLTTFALGTAVGDLTATTFGWGYLASAVVFAVAIAGPAVAHRAGRLGAVTAFWTAYVITRPLGASIADWTALPPERGGLDLGTGTTTVLWSGAIVVLVAVLSLTARPADSVVPER